MVENKKKQRTTNPPFLRYHLACSVLRTIREWNMKKKHQQYSKVENVTKTLTSIGLTKKYWKTTKMKLNQGYKKEHTGRNGSYWGENKN